MQFLLLSLRPGDEMDFGIKAKSLPRFRILHVGDVHYPEWSDAPADIDLKTKQLSPSILAALQSDGFRNLLRLISREDFLDSCDAVVFVGDFTSRGEQEKLRRALRHLAALLRVNPHSPNPKFHVVPGNHDVSRELAKTLGLSGKFEAFAAECGALGFGNVPVLNPVARKVGDQARPVQIILTNTTLGSWESVGLPEGVAKWISESTAKIDQGAKAKPKGRGKPQVAIPILDPNSYYDQLDTPFVSKETIQDIKSLIAEDAEGCIPCVVGHHNILPQRTPRVSPFGELLNQGEFRDTLLSVGRPTIYLHGHIHTDPVEIITSASVPGSKVISVSAPTISEGVNLLDIFFARSGEPIGLSVLPLRIDASGHVAVTNQMDISLRPSLAGAVAGELAEVVYRRVSVGRLSWAELRAAVPGDVNDDDLEAVVLELLWASLVRVINRTAPRQRWVLELER